LDQCEASPSASQLTRPVPCTRRKAIEQGVDGVIAVCAGAGGHAGPLSPFALVKEIRKDFDGVVILSGCITSGSDVLAARAMGADLAYSGTRFIATTEANAVPGYKEMIVESSASDIVYSSLFTGIHGSYLKGSIANAGMDPENLPDGSKADMDFSKAAKSEAKAWKDIWGAGQGVGNIDAILPARDVVLRMEEEYKIALTDLVAA
jgi:nitronate monooxygenase